MWAGTRVLRIGILLTFVILSAFTAGGQDEQITLDLWIFEGEDRFLPTVIDAFQARYPNITVQMTDIPEDDYVTKIDTALLAGEPPDIAFIYVPRWIKAGFFERLGDVISEQSINVDDFNVGALSTNCAVDGEIYCFGTYTGAVLLFYNKDLLDSAGIPYPSSTEPMTIDEYADMSLALSVPSDNIAERVWGSDVRATYWWMDWRTLFSEDGRTAVGYLDDEATIHAHQVIADMREQGSVLSASEASLVADVDLLATGRLATSIVDTVSAIRTLERAGIRWGAAVTPVEQEGDAPWVSMWTDGLGVMSGSDNTEAAKLFIAFLATEGNALRVEATDDLPLNMRIALEDNWAGDSEGRADVLEAVQTARPNIFVPDFRSVARGPIQEAFNGLMLEDGMSAQEAFDEITPIVQDNLDRAWATWDAIENGQ